MKISLKSEGEEYATRSILIGDSSIRNLIGAFILATGSTNQNRPKPYFELYDAHCEQFDIMCLP